MLQAVEQIERLARGEFVGFERGDFLQQGMGGSGAVAGSGGFQAALLGGGRRGEHIKLRALGAGLGFERFEMLLRGFERGGGQAGEFGNGDAVAFLGRPGFDVVQKHDVLPFFQRAQVHIDGGGMLLGQAGQLEIVGGKQAEGLVFLQQVFGNGLRQRQSVEGGSAAADFVHQHQRLRRGVAQDVGGFAHFDHKGRAVGGQIVGRADAGENLIDGADAGGVGGDEAAGVRQQHDVGDLAHIGGFAAHIGAGNQHQAAALVQPRVVRREAGDLHFDHRMAAVVDFDAGVIDKLRRAVVVLDGKTGKAAQHIERGGGFGALLQQGQLLLQFLHQRFVEPFFQRQSFFLRV